MTIHIHTLIDGVTIVPYLLFSIISALNKSFSDATLACLSNNRAVLKDFIREHFTTITEVPATMSLFLVALLKDYSVLVCDA